MILLVDCKDLNIICSPMFIAILLRTDKSGSYSSVLLQGTG